MVKILGTDRSGEKKKIRLGLAGGLESNWSEIMQYFPMSYEASDNLWHKLDNVEIDIWLDSETGDISVDGAW